MVKVSQFIALIIFFHSPHFTPYIFKCVSFDIATHQYELGLLDFGDSVVVPLILHVCTHLTGSFVTSSGFTVTVYSPCCVFVLEASITLPITVSLPHHCLCVLFMGFTFHCYVLSRGSLRAHWRRSPRSFHRLRHTGRHYSVWNVMRNQLHTARSYRFTSRCRDLDCVHSSRREVTDEAFAVSRPTTEKYLLCSK